MRARDVIKAIGCKHLNLYGGKGSGYWYFVYDDGNLFKTHSIYVRYLHDLSLESWVAEGMDVVNRIEPA